MDSSSLLLVEGKNTILSIVCMSSSWTRQRINMVLKVVFSGEISTRNKWRGQFTRTGVIFFEMFLRNKCTIDTSIPWSRVQAHEYSPSYSFFTSFFSDIAVKYEKRRKQLRHYTREKYDVADMVIYFISQTGQKYLSNTGTLTGMNNISSWN